jgi:CRISPR-associated protein Cmr4
MNESCLTFIQALSPLHAGTGQGVGVIDLPIAREKATNLPYLPGSTLKGSMRDECEGNAQTRSYCSTIFGPAKPESDSDAYAGSAIFTDQRLLCLPVRSLLGTFAWVTSPFILERFKRDVENIGKEKLSYPTEVKADENKEKEFCLVTSQSQLEYKARSVILEDLDLTARDDANADDWANWLAAKIFADDNWQTLFKQRFCIVSDDVMSFLAETATEIAARNSLDDQTKTTKKGALWYEESLPGETILSGLLVAVHVKAKSDEVFKIIKSLTDAKPIQLGGSMTVGRGLCRVKLDCQIPQNNQNGGTN